jgi:hypothetical protein
MMVRPVLVRPLPNYRVYLEFSDGVKGEVDLSDLAGKGVFEGWNDYSFFERVHIGPDRQIKWDEYIELCPDSLYLRLTGKNPEEAFKELQRRLGLTPAKAAEWQDAIREARR